MNKLRLHHFKIAEHKKSRRDPGVLWHMRMFWTIYLMPAEIQKFACHLELILKKPEMRFAFRFKIGNSGSENPFAGHVLFMGSGWYWGIERGRRLADWITSRKHKWSTREFKVDISNHGDGTTIYWNLFAFVSDTGGTKYTWLNNSASLSLAEWIWGPKRYSYEDLGVWETTLDMEEDSYPALLTLQKQTLKRVKAKRVISEEMVVDVEAPKGIPTHFDQSGGWKGDRTYGFGVGLPNFDLVTVEKDEWYMEAYVAVRDWVLDYRKKHNFSVETMQSPESLTVQIIDDIEAARDNAVSPKE